MLPALALLLPLTSEQLGWWSLLENIYEIVAVQWENVEKMLICLLLGTEASQHERKVSVADCPGGGQWSHKGTNI